MKLKLYQVDAFTDHVFGGNPAAICPLDEWLSEELMQKIAMENNLAETAYYLKKDGHYEIRWFTPTVEMDLCGHATLASAFILFNYESYHGELITFHSPRSGKLTVKKEGDYLTLNFPTDIYEPVKQFDAKAYGFDTEPLEVLKGKTDYVLIYENEEQVQSMKPDMALVAKLDARGAMITAKGNTVDFVSRFFAPQVGVNEDPATGSAHTTLTPYWSKKLGTTELTALQLSSRVGHFKCKYLNDRVEISGMCRIYLTGEIVVE